MSITLAVTDNADGSGATATIAGSAGGTVNTILVKRPQDASYTTTALNRTGDGTIAIPAATLSFVDLWQVEVSNNNAGTVTVAGPALVNITQGYASAWFACLIAIQKGIVNLGLPSIGGNVVRSDDPEYLARNTATLPAVLVAIPPDAERREPVTNQQTKWTFPILVIVLDNKQDVLQQVELRLYWRWAIQQAFDRKPLGSTAYRTTINPTAYAPADPQNYERWQTAFKIQCEYDTGGVTPSLTENSRVVVGSTVFSVISGSYSEQPKELDTSNNLSNYRQRIGGLDDFSAKIKMQWTVANNPVGNPPAWKSGQNSSQYVYIYPDYVNDPTHKFYLPAAYIGVSTITGDATGTGVITYDVEIKINGPYTSPEVMS